MVREFENKKEWALILGGSSGLGLASAEKLAKHGMNLIIVYRASSAQLSEIIEKFESIKQTHSVELMHFNSDIAKVESREAVLAEVQSNFQLGDSIKVLLHSVAKGNLKPMQDAKGEELKNDDFNLTLENMAISLYDWTKAVFRAQLFSEDARILSFTSEGNKKAMKSYAAVSAAKASLEAITRNIAYEFAEFGMRANCIEAGVTDTPSLRMIPNSDQIIHIAKKRNPFKRLTKAEDVANVVYLLSKDEAAWINGTVIQANGGEHLN